MLPDVEHAHVLVLHVKHVIVQQRHGDALLRGGLRTRESLRALLVNDEDESITDE